MIDFHNSNMVIHYGSALPNLLWCHQILILQCYPCCLPLIRALATLHFQLSLFMASVDLLLKIKRFYLIIFILFKRNITYSLYFTMQNLISEATFH